MDHQAMVEIVDANGNKMFVELVTYLISEDRVIYISKLLRQEDRFILDEITDDAEWNDVQRLLKKIANAE